MHRRAEASRLADAGFRTLRAGGRLLVVAADWEPAALALGLLETGGAERLLARARGPRGRAPTAVLDLAAGGFRLHLRRVMHGGWLAPLWGERLLGAGRALRELRVAAALHARGAPVPRPVLAAAWRRGACVAAAVGTAYQEGSIDASAFLSGAPSRERMLRAAAAAGRAVRAVHDAGGRHRDLHVGNLLLREGDVDTAAWVVDLDRARLVAEVSPARRAAELSRLYRSLEARGLLGAVGDAGCQAFVSAYTGEDRRLLADLRVFAPRQRRLLALRRRWRNLRGASG
jgi:3-deoxy-D-manno-octulosonic acid kinase